ncbi:hypothetical protein M3J09_010505 [Ascochyta lentis]
MIATQREQPSVLQRKRYTKRLRMQAGGRFYYHRRSCRALYMPNMSCLNPGFAAPHQVSVRSPAIRTRGSRGCLS